MLANGNLINISINLNVRKSRNHLMNHRNKMIFNSNRKNHQKSLIDNDHNDIQNTDLGQDYSGNNYFSIMLLNDKYFFNLYQIQ